MSDAVYERYKDALRRGHVAALRGRLEAALAAYSEAAGIAPERSLPHASLGRILHRLGRREEALAAFGVALDRSSTDEVALAGRADLLAELGRRTEAADALDRLAEAQERTGRIPEACDTARRALELAESRPRRRLVEQLARRLREAPADDAAAAVLERAMGILEPPRAPEAAAALADAGPDVPPAADAGEADDGREDAVDEPSEDAAPPDGSTLVAEGEALLDAGDAVAARDRLLAGAAVHREAGHVDAALDACYLALEVAPATPALHLTLAELYLARGWRGPAAEKLLLLGRLADLGGDGETRAEVCRIAAEQVADDDRLAAFCA